MKDLKRIFLTILTIMFLSGNALAFMVSWDASTDDVNGYRIYYSPDLQEVSSKTAPFIEVAGSKTSACIDLGINEYTINGFFAGATAYNDSGESDLSNIVYILFGNIYGNDWDGVSSSEARVDGQDLNVLGFYFGQSVTHQELDCAVDFILENPDLKQRSDLNGDGRIDGYDLFQLAIRFGNTLPP